MNVRQKQGRALYGVQMRLIDPDTKQVLPRNGTAVGELMVKGPWVTAGYYQLNAAGQAAQTWEEQCNTDDEGWFGTSDIGTIDRSLYT